MVKLHTSLLAVTLATVSAVASSNEFQRRSESDVQQPITPHFRFGLAAAGRINLQSRGFEDEEDLFERDYPYDDVEARAFSAKSAGELFSFGKKVFESKHAKSGFKQLGNVYKHGKRIGGHKNTKHALHALDTASQVYGDVQTFENRGLEDEDLEAREPAGGYGQALGDAWRFGEKIAKHKNTKHLMTAVDVGSQAYGAYQMVKSRGLEDVEDLFVRDLDAFDDLEAREPGGKGELLSDAWKFGEKIAKHKNTKHLMTAVDVGSQAYGAYQMVKSRGLEDDEDLFVRDLDAFDDLEAREPGGKGELLSDAFKFGERIAKHKNTKHLMTAVDVGSQAYGAYQMVKSRGLEDEDIFERDLDTDELFGREYDLLDERDTFDDLD